MALGIFLPLFPRIEMNKVLAKTLRRKSPSNRHRLLERKRGFLQLSEPSFYIAGGGNKLILQIHLRKTFVADTP